MVVVMGTNPVIEVNFKLESFEALVQQMKQS